MTKQKMHLFVLIPLLFFPPALCVAAPPPNGTARDEDWRATALKDYDQNKDGRLSDAEREAMRKQVFAQRRRGSGRSRGMMFPPEIVAKYDKDGDGSLDEAEGQAAQQALMKIFQDLQQKYDTNHNGNFEPAEVQNLQADAAAGKLEEVPKFFIQMLGQRGRRPRGNPSAAGRTSGAEIEPRKFDKNNDGRLSEEELRAARAALKGQETPPSSPALLPSRR